MTPANPQGGPAWAHCRYCGRSMTRTPADRGLSDADLKMCVRSPTGTHQLCNWRPEAES